MWIFPRPPMVYLVHTTIGCHLPYMNTRRPAIAEGKAEKENNSSFYAGIIAIILLGFFAIWAWENPTTSNVDTNQVISVTSFSSNPDTRSGIFSFWKEKNPDLKVTILSTGIFDDAGNYYEGDTLKSDRTGAARIEVANIGEARSATWTLSATLPTKPIFTFNSETQPPLAPSEVKILRMTFNQMSPTTNAAFIVSVETNDVDPENNVATKLIPIVE